MKLKSFTKRRWAVLISGRGSNLGAIIDAKNEDRAELVVVYTSSSDAYGIKRANRAGVPVRSIPRQDKKIDYARLDQELRELHINSIFLAGFMRVLPADFVEAWESRLFNLHPSLLPTYPGLESIERSYQDKAPMGCTIHEVTAEVDAGRRLLQRGLSQHPKSLASGELAIHLLEQTLVRRAVARC